MGNMRPRRGRGPPVGDGGDSSSESNERREPVEGAVPPGDSDSDPRTSDDSAWEEEVLFPLCRCARVKSIPHCLLCDHTIRRRRIFALTWSKASRCLVCRTAIYERSRARAWCWAFLWTFEHLYTRKTTRLKRRYRTTVKGRKNSKWKRVDVTVRCFAKTVLFVNIMKYYIN